MAKKSKIIFDFDGVLRQICFNSVYEAYLAIAEYLGRDPRDFWKDFKDFNEWMDYADWRRNLERMGVSRESDYPEIRGIFHEICDPRFKMFPWVNKILEDLEKRHELHILSSSFSKSIHGSLNGSAKFFSQILGCDHVSKMKPDPEGINLILKRTGAEVSDVIMIGDTHVDIRVGKSAGVYTALVTWGVPIKKGFLNPKPDFILNDYNDLKLL